MVVHTYRAIYFINTRGVNYNTMKKQRSIYKQEALTAFGFMLPFLLGVIVFLLIPILYTLYITFIDFNTINGLEHAKFVGFKNFIDVLHDKDAMISFRLSMVYSLIYSPAMIVFSLIMAVAMNQKFRFKNFSRTMIFMPYIANMVAVSIIWSALLNPMQGPVNTVLRMIGISNPPMWLADPNLALPVVAMIATWQNMAFQTIVFLAALQDVPEELYEASKIDGAGYWKTFLKVTLPWISPTTFFLVITTVIGSAENFSNVYTLTKGGPGGSTEVVAINIYKNAFMFNKFSFAAAQAVILFAILMIITLIQWRGQKRWVNY